MHACSCLDYLMVQPGASETESLSFLSSTLMQSWSGSTTSLFTGGSPRREQQGGLLCRYRGIFLG